MGDRRPGIPRRRALTGLTVRVALC